jgi:hypothetical protein
VTVTGDALLVAEGLGEGLAEHDADVLHRVVRIDRQIAARAYLDVEEAVPRDSMSKRPCRAI